MLVKGYEGQKVQDVKKAIQAQMIEKVHLTVHVFLTIIVVSSSNCFFVAFF